MASKIVLMKPGSHQIAFASEEEAVELETRGWVRSGTMPAPIIRSEGIVINPGEPGHPGLKNDHDPISHERSGESSG